MSLHDLIKNIRVVLVEPGGPINVGSVARLCANFGVGEIRVVSPRCNILDSEAKKMALRGAALLEAAPHFSSLLEAVSDCRRVVATCARIDHGDIPLHTPREVLPWLLEGIDDGPIALVFGREDRGLTNEELLVANKVLTLEIDSDYLSLNLSHAVAIVLYEFQCLKALNPGLSINQEKPHFPTLATPAQVADCLTDTQELLLDVGFLLDHTAKARMSKVRRFLRRSEIRPEEVAFIRGMIRQIRWAINSVRL